MVTPAELLEAVTRLQERLARVEADMAGSEARLAPLLEEKEALLQEMERLAAQRQAGAVEPDLYETSLRALVDRLALIDEEVSAAAGANLPQRVDSVERGVVDLEKSLAGVEKSVLSVQGTLDKLSESRPVEELRKAVDALGVELRENVRRLLQVDSRTIEELKEIQTLVRGGRMETIEAEIQRVRQLYQEFVSEDRLSKFTESVRAILRKEEIEPLRREELQPLQKSLDKVEVALERQADEVQTRFAEIRGQVEALREEALRLQRERVEALQKWVGDLARQLGEQVKEVPLLREQFQAFQSRVEGLSSDLRSLGERVRYRTTEELETERASLQAELDLLRGAAERGAMPREQAESRAGPLAARLQEVQERLDSRKRTEELGRTLEEQRQAARTLLDELRKVPKPEEIRGLLEQMRRSMAAHEMEALRGEMHIVRATLRNRIEEIPVAIEARLRAADEDRMKPLVRHLEAEASRLAASLGRTLRKEMAAQVPPEVERLSRGFQEPVLEEIRRISARTEEAIGKVSEEVARLRATMGNLTEEAPALRREVERLESRMDLLARRTERQDIETLLGRKEKALQALEKLQAEAARGLLGPRRLEEELQRAVADVADIDARIEEQARSERILARIQEQGERVAALARSIEEVRAQMAAGESMEEKVLGRVRELLSQQEAVLITAQETRLRALHLEFQRQREETAALRARLETQRPPPGASPDLSSDLASIEARSRQAAERVAREVAELRDAVAAVDIRLTRAEPALDARLRLLEEGQRRLETLQGEAERLRHILLAPSGPRKTLDELQAERRRLLDFLQGPPS